MEAEPPLARVFVGWLKTHQKEDGSVSMPPALRTI